MRQSKFAQDYTAIGWSQEFEPQSSPESLLLTTALAA